MRQIPGSFITNLRGCITVGYSNAVGRDDIGGAIIIGNLQGVGL